MSALAVTYSALCDPTSGAAVSLRDALAMLREAGWRTDALTGPHFEARRGVRPAPLATLRALGTRPVLGTTLALRIKHALAKYDDDGLETTQFIPGLDAEVDPGREASAAFAELLERRVLAARPSVIVTFGGGVVGREIASVAHRHRIPLVFWLRNAAYHKASLFEHAAGVLVSSRFLAEHYERDIGIESTPIPSPVRWERVLVPDRHKERRSLTFITPTKAKGLLFAARIVEQLLAKLPHVPVTVVEGRGSVDDLLATGAVFPRANLRVIRATRDPRTFYGDTRVLLAPSLWHEASLRSGVEAMINEIPTIASDRGGIPETLGDSGQVLHIPATYSAYSDTLPSADAVRPWVEAIARMWTDEPHYRRERARCQREAKRYAWAGVAARYQAYFANIVGDRAPSPPRSTTRHAQSSCKNW